MELEPETSKFGKPEKLADGRRVRVSVEVFGKGVFKVRLLTRVRNCESFTWICIFRALEETIALPSARQLSVLLRL